MSDPLTVRRIIRRLQDPAFDTVEARAEAVLREAERTVQTRPIPALPSNPFWLLVRRSRDVAARVVGEAPTLGAAQQLARDYLVGEGDGEVLIVEVVGGVAVQN